MYNVNGEAICSFNEIIEANEFTEIEIAEILNMNIGQKIWYTLCTYIERIK